MPAAAGTGPFEPQTRLAEAVALREQGRADRARDLLLELSAAHPDDPVVAYQTAWTHDALGLEAEAVPYYERALAAPGGLSPDHHRGACLGLGSTLRSLGRYEEAAAVLRGGLAAFPGDNALRTFLAMALYNTGEHHEATATLLRLLTATTTDPDITAYRRAIDLYAEDLDRTW
ncbi:tetratricopeptide repeat protein [Streptomyces sp. YIM 98790]|uniref:tetratricopeptide repeat protein n=1 Tax=Streptomyces sp. YIM 98790 TaxID=2689077 RepID=UPI0014099FC5|nr:tetratricopeptide repeat protein [Streptomyces sp. YIM 98790]